MENNVRIAVCLSGQPRTWNKCIQSWESLFSRFAGEIDYFYHLWNFNSLPHILPIPDSEFQSVDSDELSGIQQALNPKKYVIEDHVKSMKVMSDSLAAGKLYPLSKGTIAHWTSSQFYSNMRAAHLKRQYEIENNFEYDLCIKMRMDLFFTETDINHHLEFLVKFKSPDANTIYSCHNGRYAEFPTFRIGDIFYFSDSITFDKLAEFYRYLPIIGNAPFNGNGTMPPEIPFTFFVKMLNIQNHDTKFDPKVMRTLEYVYLKEQTGHGSLGSHELI